MRIKVIRTLVDETVLREQERVLVHKLGVVREVLKALKAKDEPLVSGAAIPGLMASRAATREARKALVATA